MRVAARIESTDQDPKRLERWARGRSTPARLVLRARIVLMAAAGAQNLEIADRLGTSRQTVGLWRSLVLAQGLDGIAKDALPPGGGGVRRGNGGR